MPARQGKSKEKIKIDIHTEDFFNYYKKHTFDDNAESKFYLTPKQYGAFIKTYFDELTDKMIFENYHFNIPYRMGTLSIRKYQRGIKIVDGKVRDNFPVDWNETLKLWERDEEAKEKKVLVKHLNKHSDGYVYKWIWNRQKMNTPNHMKWYFRPTRTNKLKLKAAINSKMVDFYDLF